MPHACEKHYDMYDKGRQLAAFVIITASYPKCLPLEISDPARQLHCGTQEPQIYFLSCTGLELHILHLDIHEYMSLHIA